MKLCPQCRRDYFDDTLSFCLDDGSALLEGPASVDEPATAILSEPGANRGPRAGRPLGVDATGLSASESPTRSQINTTDQAAIYPRGTEAEPQENSDEVSERQSLSRHQAAKPQGRSGGRFVLFLISGVAVLIIVAGFFSYRYLGPTNSKQIESIAVMPFVNEGGNAEVEYLSDGMTETLISRLAQLPNLNVKARSTVFHYKGKVADPAKIGRELAVRAVLLGRVVSRGEQIIVFLELVDASTGDQIWGDQYNRNQSDLVALQNEIALDVSNKLRTRLSGTEQQRLSKNYTQNAEANQLYLKGRYHLLKTTRNEIEKGVSYFQQAIAIDPSYALAQAGLADANRTLAMAGERPPREFMPLAKAAAARAIELDDTLAEAHGILGFVLYWYDRDWNAAEREMKRAIELDPNNSDTRIYYAHLLSSTGRVSQSLSEARRSSELEPLNARNNALECQFLIAAGQNDEALIKATKVIDLNPDHWLPHQQAAAAYIEKGMYAEAVVEARKSMERNEFATVPRAFLGYALAKAGRRAEAEAVLDELLRMRKEDYASPYSIAMVYYGLGKHDETMAWLEQAVEARDPRVVFLTMDPKWKNLRGDPRFQDLLRRIGLPQG
ncbi:MAG: hypothetical protein ABR535_08725 [Pyrinomonadaceae bacterium]